MLFYSLYHTSQSSTEFIEIYNSHKLIHVVQDTEVLDNDNYFKQLAKLVGIPIIYEEDPVTGKIIANKWTEIKYDKTKSAETYKHSSTFQPLHTDYGYFSFEIESSFFYCIEQAAFGGATTFIDVDRVVNVLENNEPVLFEKLQKNIIQFGRKNNPIAHFNGFILSKDEFGWKINWNYYRAITDEQNRELINEFKNFLDIQIEKSGELIEIKLKPGEAVFFKDRRLLHGRNSFIGNRQLNKGAIATCIPNEVIQLLG